MASKTPAPRPVGIPDCVQAVAQVEDDFMGRDGVVAVAVGRRTVGGRETEEPCVKVFVRRKRDLSELTPPQVLPRTIELPDGHRVPVDVEEMAPPSAGVGAVGGARAGAPMPRPHLRHRVRPAVGGYSVAHYLVTAGTIATGVRDRQHAGRFYLLSNNHVLANSNAGRFEDPVLQPGPLDGGCCATDTIGRLARCVPIDFSRAGGNLVDAAIAEVAFRDVERRVYGIGYPQAVRRRQGVQLGELVQKTGRTSDYTQGRIIGVHGTVRVDYSGGRVARYRGQIFTTPMSAGGDSGSLGLDLDGNALGLLFAGSSTHTIFNYVEDVQAQLGIIVAERTV